MRRALFSCSVIPALLWSPWSGAADPLFQFVDRGLAGFIDRAGRVVVAPAVLANPNHSYFDGKLVFDGRKVLDRDGRLFELPRDVEIERFSEGLASARSGSLHGYVDHGGVWAIPPLFRKRGGDFSEGLAVVEMNGRYGYLDHSGQFAISPRFAAARAFRGGFARVVVDAPCITAGDPEDRSPCERLSLHSLGRRDPGRRTPNCRWTFIAKTGRQAFPGEFELAGDFHEGLAAVQSGVGWGFVDESGAMVIAPRFADVRPFSDGLALVRDQDGACFIDRGGVLTIRVPSFGDATPFSSGRARLGNRDSGFVFIGKDGKQAIPEKFRDATPFLLGLAHVQLSERPEMFAYIDPSGRHVFEYRR